ncbi:MAG TPA: hypothetical protein VF463_07740 [Sphingobium sp.]
MGDILYGDAIHIREQAKIDAARTTQKSGNELRGAQTALQQFSASLSNKRAMDAAGKNIGVITENIGRSLDASATGAFSSRIAAAEQAGAAAAMAASAGVGGSSVESYNETSRLSQALADEQRDRQVNSQNIAMSESRGATLTDAVAGMDNNVYRASIDYTQFVDHQKTSTFSKLATLGVAAAATYFGGPQAGMAVVGMHEAGAAANNGDFASAAGSVMGALGNAAGAAKSYQETGGHYWSAAKQKSGTAASWAEVPALAALPDVWSVRPAYGSISVK